MKKRLILVILFFFRKIGKVFHIINEILIPKESYLAKIRIQLNYYKFQSVGKNCSLGKNVKISPQLEIILKDNVAIRDNVTFSGKGLLLINSNSIINENCMLSCYKKIHIGKNVMIAANSQILDVTHNYKRADIPISLQGYTTREVLIEDNVWVGAQSIILMGVIIKSGSIIGANSLVTKSVPQNQIYAGSPAKLIKARI